MPGLFPTFDAVTQANSQRVMCRPNPVGGCISLIKYERLYSNRLKEFGPYDRFVDRARLTLSLTLDDIYGPDRYAIALKLPVMGTVLRDRPAYLSIIYPFKGMSCPVAPATAPVSAATAASTSVATLNALAQAAATT